MARLLPGGLLMQVSPPRCPQDAGRPHRRSARRTV